jgi:DNA-binding NtrC family response regulator
MVARYKVLLVDDDSVIRSSIRHYLQLRGMHVTEADSLLTAREKFASATTDAAIVDFSLPDGDGLDLLEHFKSTDPAVPVIVLTGQGSIELAVRAIKEGAEQFLTKPVELPVLHTLVLRAVENKRLRTSQKPSARGLTRSWARARLFESCASWRSGW